MKDLDLLECLGRVNLVTKFQRTGLIICSLLERRKPPNKYCRSSTKESLDHCCEQERLIRLITLLSLCLTGTVVNMNSVMIAWLIYCNAHFTYALISYLTKSSCIVVTAYCLHHELWKFSSRIAAFITSLKVFDINSSHLTYTLFC